MKRSHLSSVLLAAIVSGATVIAAKTFGDGDLPEFLQRFDTNNDDQIDEEERQAIRDLRSRLREEKRQSIDLNNDGDISAGEIREARQIIREKIEQRRLEKFLSIAGEDSLISPTEYAAIPGIAQFPDRVFEAIWTHLDVDGDEFISFAEFSGVLRLHD